MMLELNPSTVFNVCEQFVLVIKKENEQVDWTHTKV